MTILLRRLTPDAEPSNASNPQSPSAPPPEPPAPLPPPPPPLEGGALTTTVLATELLPDALSVASELVVAFSCADPALPAVNDTSIVRLPPEASVPSEQLAAPLDTAHDPPLGTA